MDFGHHQTCTHTNSIETFDVQHCSILLCCVYGFAAFS